MKENVVRGLISDVRETGNSHTLIIEDKSGNIWECSNMEQVNKPSDPYIKYNGWEFVCDVHSADKTGKVINERMHILLINPFQLWNPREVTPADYKRLEAVLILPMNE